MEYIEELYVDRLGRFLGRLIYRNGNSEMVEIIGADFKGHYYYRRLSF